MGGGGTEGLTREGVFGSRGMTVKPFRNEVGGTGRNKEIIRLITQREKK